MHVCQFAILCFVFVARADFLAKFAKIEYTSIPPVGESDYKNLGEFLASSVVQPYLIEPTVTVYEHEYIDFRDEYSSHSFIKFLAKVGPFTVRVDFEEEYNAFG